MWEVERQTCPGEEFQLVLATDGSDAGMKSRAENLLGPHGRPVRSAPGSHCRLHVGRVRLPGRARWRMVRGRLRPCPRVGQPPWGLRRGRPVGDLRLGEGRIACAVRVNSASPRWLVSVADPLRPWRHGSLDRRRLGVPIFSVEIDPA
jgi:hypothetical protein